MATTATTATTTTMATTTTPPSRPLWPPNTFPYELRKKFLDPYRPDALAGNMVSTHNCLTGGTWSIPAEKEETFLMKYCQSLEAGQYMYFVERITTERFRFFVDLDIMDDHPWDDTKIMELVQFIQSSLVSSFFEELPSLSVIVSRCPSRPKGTKWKTGIHLIYPDLMVDTTTCVLLLKLLQQGLIKTPNPFQHNDWMSWIDTTVLNGNKSKTGLRMHGSYKCEICPACDGKSYRMIETDMGTHKVKKAHICPVCQSSWGSCKSQVAEFVQAVNNGESAGKLEFRTKVNCPETLYDFMSVLQADGQVATSATERCRHNFYYFILLRSVRGRPNLFHSVYEQRNLMESPLLPLLPLPGWFELSRGDTLLRSLPAVTERTTQTKLLGSHRILGSFDFVGRQSVAQKVQSLIRVYGPQYQMVNVLRITVNQCEDGKWRGFLATGSSCKWCPHEKREHRSNHLSFLFHWDPTHPHGWVFPRCNDDQCKKLKRKVSDQIALPDYLTKMLCGLLHEEPPLPSSTLLSASSSASSSSASSSASLPSDTWRQALADPNPQFILTKEKEKEKEKERKRKSAAISATSVTPPSTSVTSATTPSTPATSATKKSKKKETK